MKGIWQRFYRKTHHHIKTNRKKYLRFVSFTIILAAFRIVEHYFLLRTIGIELETNIFILLVIVFIAFTFTVISELTEKMVEKEEPKIEKFIKKEESIIENREKSIQKKIKRRVNI